MKTFHTGGVVGPRAAVRPQGVVGYLAGRLVFDGEWFDQHMAALRPTISVVVNGEHTPPAPPQPLPRRR